MKMWLWIHDNAFVKIHTTTNHWECFLVCKYSLYVYKYKTEYEEGEKLKCSCEKKNPIVLKMKYITWLKGKEMTEAEWTCLENNTLSWYGKAKGHK